MPAALPPCRIHPLSASGAPCPMPPAPVGTHWHPMPLMPGPLPTLGTVLVRLGLCCLAASCSGLSVWSRPVSSPALSACLSFFPPSHTQPSQSVSHAPSVCPPPFLPILILIPHLHSFSLFEQKHRFTHTRSFLPTSQQEEAEAEEQSAANSFNPPTYRHTHTHRVDIEPTEGQDQRRVQVDRQKEAATFLRPFKRLAKTRTGVARFFACRQTQQDCQVGTVCVFCPLVSDLEGSSSSPLLPIVLFSSLSPGQLRCLHKPRPDPLTRPPFPYLPPPTYFD